MTSTGQGRKPIGWVFNDDHWRPEMTSLAFITPAIPVAKLALPRGAGRSHEPKLDAAPLREGQDQDCGLARSQRRARAAILALPTA